MTLIYKRSMEVNCPVPLAIDEYSCYIAFLLRLKHEILVTIFMASPFEKNPTLTNKKANSFRYLLFELFEKFIIQHLEILDSVSTCYLRHVAL